MRDWMINHPYTDFQDTKRKAIELKNKGHTTGTPVSTGASKFRICIDLCDSSLSHTSACRDFISLIELA